MNAARLYTPEILALAVELHEYPLTDALRWRGDARSPACGSTLELGLAQEDGTVTAIGLRLSACAIGQASAAIFARHAVGCAATSIDRIAREMAEWLGGTGPAPDWPDLDLLEPARAFPGRHGAMLLPWNAATAALSNPPRAG